MKIAKWLPIAQPSVYVTLFLLTELSKGRTANGGNPFVCVSLPFSLPMIARDDTATIVIVGVLATAWWYFIGLIGLRSHRRKMSRVGSGLGAALIFFICAIDALLMFSELRLIASEERLNAIDIPIYLLATALACGGIVSALYATGSALRNRND